VVQEGIQRQWWAFVGLQGDDMWREEWPDRLFTFFQVNMLGMRCNLICDRLDAAEIMERLIRPLTRRSLATTMVVARK
jgi:hypothetical protein